MEADPRTWLIRRLWVELQALWNAEPMTRDQRLGHVLAYIEVGEALGYWTTKDARRMANLAEHRWGIARIMKVARQG